MPKKKIAMVLTDWNANAYRQENDLYGGIGYYRVVKPAQCLRKWFDVEIIGSDFRHWGIDEVRYGRLGKDYDLIFSKHIDNGQAASNLLAVANHYNKKVVVDIDDDYLNIREDNPAFNDYDKLKGGRYFLGAMLSLANGLVVSTDPLAKVYGEADMNSNIDVLPNCNDINDWLFPIKKHTDGKIRIGYAGGNAHGDDINLLIEPMARILDDYPHVIFQIVGAVTALEAKTLGEKMNGFSKRDISSQIEITGGTLAWREYPPFLCSMGWDIGLAPLVDDQFNRGKSHIKWMEYSMIGAVTIASPVYPYKQDIQGVHTIQDGKTGLFSNSIDEWYLNMKEMIENEDLRKKYAKAAYLYIKKNWQYSQHAEKWKKVIDKYL